ncbi:MAG: hypothetical protein UX04_C0006G0062 [Microgenomates group bacterium GW2011_GWF2_45_18]|nr:MAG: hypothetical protein UW18_C0006G0062 [Microgenomates group bacterium GW2011_GWF1_44_10]KKU01527.1 MAG: hypothetical protein UX04_C0006G0062 [Microgenomates group bacterium GW2011_GWF2_45_18]OGJ41424.1 MAG: hypothetical protein A2378_00170 [Candidatus Pacebacteria bacterium RIFOXYB1_FULL_44_10]HAU99435.1 hypothetical protein [Candidatus Paceibacterota bacterium]HAX01559.1 hypothetical protein [Candidatus Paceibacterota bacterium]
MDLFRKTALVTGGATGLGFEIASLLLEKGMIVWICGRSRPSLLSAQSKLSSPYVFIQQCDISNPAQVAEMKKQIGHVDVLINNAGVWCDLPLEDTSIDQISQTVQVNLLGTIYVSQAFFSSMKTKGEGIIANISSALGVHTRKHVSVYSASKFGVRGFTESLRDELKGTGIRVFGWYPGGMKTGLFEHAGQGRDMTGYIDAKDMAKLFVSMLEVPQEMTIETCVAGRTE